MAILIMAIIFLLATFLLHISNMQYLIANASKNNIQSYYLGEGKVYKILYLDKYYNREVLPRIKYNLQEKVLAINKEFNMDWEDLVNGDRYRKVIVSFIEEESRKIMKIRTGFDFKGIKGVMESKVYIIKDLYELNEVILYDGFFTGSRREEYIEYMELLQGKIGLNITDDDIMVVESKDYEKIVILEEDHRKYMDFYRNHVENPIKRQYINKDNFFLIIRDSGELILHGEENLKLSGIIYTEGDIKINKNLDFCGIIILKGGEITLYPDSRFNLEGIILSRDYPFKSLGSEVYVNYNKSYIRKNGIYLPGFIELEMKVLQLK